MARPCENHRRILMLSYLQNVFDPHRHLEDDATNAGRCRRVEVVEGADQGSGCGLSVVRCFSYGGCDFCWQL